MAATHLYQQRFWNQLIQLKGHALYLNLYHLNSERMDNSLSILLAVASNGSIAGWAIWNKAQFIWAVIIAGAQLVNAIRNFLPYQRRMKSLAELAVEVQEILLFAESRWYSVSEGELTSRQIHDLILEIKRRENAAENKHLKRSPLPRKPRLVTAAEKLANEYFATMYGSGGKDE